MACRAWQTSFGAAGTMPRNLHALVTYLSSCLFPSLASYVPHMIRARRGYQYRIGQGEKSRLPRLCHAPPISPSSSRLALSADPVPRARHLKPPADLEPLVTGEIQNPPRSLRREGTQPRRTRLSQTRTSRSGIITRTSGTCNKYLTVMLGRERLGGETYHCVVTFW